MSSMPWIKLYTEILDDPKLGRLPDSAKWRFVQLCLLAGECDAEGYLVNGIEPLTDADIAWRLRVNEADLLQDIERLAKLGLVEFDEGEFRARCVVNFSKRQGRSQSEKREAWRERKRRQREQEQETDGTSENVPQESRGNHTGVTLLEESREEESREEESREEEKESSGKKPPPPPAIQGYRKATHLYPTKSLWPGIVKVVGDEPADLARFEKVCTAWVAMGWNKKNVKGMLQHYSENRIPGDDGPAKGKNRDGTRQQKRINIQGYIPTYATPEEFYGTKAEPDQ